MAQQQRRNVHNDMTKLEKAFFQNLVPLDEYGSIGLDCKRPFGNSFVQGDVLQIIGWGRNEVEHEYSDEQLDYANKLLEGLIEWLKGKYGKS